MASKKKRTRTFGAQVKILYPFLWLLARLPIHTLFRIHVDGTRQVNADKRGCIIVANHQSNADPFLLHGMLNRQVQFFVSDSNMRSRLSRCIFWLFGGIAKTKFMQDFKALRKAVSVLKGGGLVGIFPEGLASWDGNSVDIIEATSKLVKLLSVPVYSVSICGSYFTLPRWGNSGIRRGQVNVKYRALFMPQQIKQLTVEEISAQIQQAITVRTQEAQRDRQHVYRSKRRAEYVERFLFLCPCCRQIGTLISQNNTISCASCGELADLDSKYALQPPHTDPSAHIKSEEHTHTTTTPRIPFADLAEWNTWQQQYWRTQVTKQATANDKSASTLSNDTNAATTQIPRASLLLPEEKAVVKIGYRQQPLSLSGLFTLSFTTDGKLVYRAIDDRAQQTIRTQRGEQGNNIIHLATEIDGYNIQNKELLEYYHDQVLYQVTICSPRRNAYKWMLTLRYFKDTQKVDESN